MTSNQKLTRRVPPELLSRQSMYQGRVVDVGTERLRFSDGREENLDMIHHPGAAAIVAVDDAGQTCLVRQYRHGVREYLWEIPAGKLDAQEPPSLCAMRELKEETGVQARDWTPLGVYVPAPGILTEKVHLFLARGLEKGEAQPETDEDLEIWWLPLSQALEMVCDGRCDDGKTALGVLRAHAVVSKL